jgi:hypothetical protein
MGTTSSKANATNATTKPKAPTITSKDVCLLNLKTQRDKLKIHKQKLETTQSMSNGLIKEYMREGRRREALVLLKRVKYQNVLIANCENQLFTLEQLVCIFFSGEANVG